MVFETGDEDAFEGMTEDEFDALEVGDIVVHIHDAPDSAAVANDELGVGECPDAREVLGVGDHNPLAGGRVSVEVQGGTIGRDNIDKWTVVEGSR
jgi:hypothetical protein